LRTAGFGGRGHIDYRDPANVLSGVMADDVRDNPRKRHKPRYVKTPFGYISSGGSRIKLADSDAADIHDPAFDYWNAHFAL